MQKRGLPGWNARKAAQQVASNRNAWVWPGVVLGLPGAGVAMGWEGEGG